MVKGDNSRRRKDALAKCEETVEELRQENAELRKAAQAFGELAERLNKNRRPDAQASRSHRTSANGPEGITPGQVSAPQSDSIESIEIHDLVPRGNKVPRELLLRVRASVDLREGSKLRVRSEDEVDAAGGPSGIALLAAASLE